MSDDKRPVHIRNEAKLTFKEMWNRDDLSDVQLCCDRKRFHVHRFLLAACSPYFQSLFQKNACENLTIEIDNVKCADLEHVLTYMYEGSVQLKNDDLQGFGELLEMFLMPLPADMTVAGDNATAKAAAEEDDLESSEGIEDDEIGDFIANVRDVFAQLTVDNLTEQSAILFGLANGSMLQLEAIGNILLQNVVEVTANCNSRLLCSLAKTLCAQAQSKEFQEHIRKKAVHVLRYLFDTASKQREPSQNDGSGSNSGVQRNAINRLDQDVIRIEQITYHWNVWRRRRFTHFMAELFAANIVSYTDIYHLKRTYPELATDLILKNQFEPINCCDFKTLSVPSDNIYSEPYRRARDIEQHLFCLQIQNVQNDLLNNFDGFINAPQPNRARKRRPGKRPNANNNNASNTKSTRTN